MDSANPARDQHRSVDLISSLFPGARSVGSGDANGDGVTVADIFYLINFLFANGPAPV